MVLVLTKPCQMFINLTFMYFTRMGFIIAISLSTVSTLRLNNSNQWMGVRVKSQGPGQNVAVSVFI